MKTKLLSALCISISLLGFISCGNQAPKATEPAKGFEKSIDLNSIVDSSFKNFRSDTVILDSLASVLIMEYRTATQNGDDYNVSANWYFKTEHIQDLLATPGKTIAGIRFYSAINDNSKGVKHLTFVAVPVEINNAQPPVISDYLGYKLFEFAQTCPKLCKKISPESDQLKSNIGVSIPHSYYFPKDILISILETNEVKFLKLGRRIGPSPVMDLTLTGVDKEEEHIELTNTYINIGMPCVTGCSVSTPFYHTH